MATVTDRGLWWRLVPVAALLTFTLVLRAPITVIPPLLGTLRDDLHLDAATAGLLTSIPVLCFGLLTPVASRVLGATGVNRGAVICILGVMLGSAVRSVGGFGIAIVGTVLIGVSLAIGNLAVPMLIGRQYQHRAELLTGAYALTTNVTVTATTAFAVPAALLLGWRWTTAATGLVLGALALAVWVVVYPAHAAGTRSWIRMRGGHPDPSLVPPGPPTTPPSWFTRRTVLLIVAFASHTFLYYALTGWLPTALGDLLSMTSTQAGLAASVMQVVGIAGPLLVPLLAGLRWSSLRIVTAMGVAWVVMPAGLLLAPSWWVAWSIFGGIAQAGFFTAVMSVVIRQARSLDENRRTTAVMQTVGYAVASLGPVAVGAIRQHTGSWALAFAMLTVVACVMLAAAVLAIRAPQAA